MTNKRKGTRPEMFIGADQVKEVTSFKYHGIYIDTRLKYNAHIKHVESKLGQLCGVSFRLSIFLNFQAAKNMYYQGKICHLDFCTFSYVCRTIVL